MRSLRRLPAFLLVLALFATGCSTSRDATRPNPSPPAAEETPPPERSSSPQPKEESAPSAEPVPNDSATNEPAPGQTPQDWHHRSADEDGYPGIGTERAYALLEGRRPQDTVVVAVLDAGLDTTHEDLDDNLWTNRDEIPGNDRDDDQNGYVDDRHGWNFIGGPDGENVEHDTYELTRLYADLHAEYKDADPDQLSGEAHEEYERYQKIKAAYQQKKQRLTRQYNQIQQINVFIQQARPLVEAEFDTSDPITLDRLQAVGSGAGSRVQQAIRAFTALLQQSGAADVADLAKEIDKAEEQLRTRVEYGLNPDFDPRPIVGDDYSDPTERIYGNPDVKGPDAGHGTGVASLIGAERDNDLGLRGIAQAVKLMPVRTVPGGDERDKDVANAIRYAVDNGADIINMSFGKGYSPRKEVVDAAVRHADEQNVLMVHAAGNDGVNIDTSASFPSKFYADDGGAAQNWISVGASSAEGDSLLAAPFSNYGAERVDLFAPGASIYVARPQNSYGQVQGTSFAAPVVTGVAALVMAYYPELSVSQVKEAILSSVTDYSDATVRRPGGQASVRFGTLSRTGGIVNAHGALRAAAKMADE